MALKFLNKKGWHTGSLRNIENVWKAEQKHEAEQKKLEELRKQIQDERERSEFRLLQQQAGLIPAQERLEFLYDSGLSVGKGSSSSKGGEGVAFKSTEEIFPTSNDNVGNRAPAAAAADVASSSKQSSVPGALFEDKPQSANDAWRKLHSDPLLMIRQREQEALARIKNNPVQMALIRKSVEKNKDKEQSHEKKEHRKKHDHSKSRHHKHASSKQHSDSDDESNESRRYPNESRRRKDIPRSPKYRERKSVRNEDRDSVKKDHRKSTSDKRDPDANIKERETRSFHDERSHDSSVAAVSRSSYHKRRNGAPKLSEEERAARLREMQEDAELHEEQRWKRLKKAEADDAQEANRAIPSGGRNFLDAAQKSVYGAERGGSKTIEESVRRRTYYSQRSESESNAFRR